MNLEEEKAALQKATDDISAASDRIQRQEALIKELAAEGHDTSTASELLVVLRGSLEAMIEHRGTIADMVAKIRQGKL